MNRAFKLLIVGGVGLVALVITTIVSLPQDQSLTHFQQARNIRIGYAVEAPYAFLKPGGAVTGEDPEVAKVIVARLGIQHIEWRLSEFGSLISELQAGRIDAIAAGMFITPERAKDVSFSEPTFHVQQGLLVPRGNPRQLRSYAQAAILPDIKIAVISGAVEETLLQRIGLPDRQIVRVPDALTGRVAVETGVVDGLALSSPTIQWMALQNQLGSTEMAQPFEPPLLAAKERLGYGAVVFRKGDRQLLAAWNAALRTFIGSPEHLTVIAPFGFTAAKSPGGVTTLEVLSQP